MMRPVRGQTAFVRALWDDLAPMFGVRPFTVQVEAAGFGTGPEQCLVTVHWRGWRYWLPVRRGLFADRRMCRWLIGRIGWELWREQLPRQQRSRRRWPVGVGA